MQIESELHDLLASKEGLEESLRLAVADKKNAQDQMFGNCPLN